MIIIAQALLVRNIGEFVDQSDPNQMSTSGFEISANKISFDKIKMSYSMQGGLLGNWCGFTNTTNFVFLNGRELMVVQQVPIYPPQNIGFDYIPR